MIREQARALRDAQPFDPDIVLDQNRYARQRQGLSSSKAGSDGLCLGLEIRVRVANRVDRGVALSGAGEGFRRDCLRRGFATAHSLGQGTGGKVKQAHGAPP